jgi:hypothetical protein
VGTHPKALDCGRALAGKKEEALGSDSGKLTMGKCVIKASPERCHLFFTFTEQLAQEGALLTCIQIVFDLWPLFVADICICLNQRILG